MNNRFNERIYNEFKHSFSLCDIDGVAYKFYKFRDGWRYRLIIYEVKNKNEELTKTQLTTLRTVAFNINWKKFDSKSGAFIFRSIDDDFNEVSITDILKDKEYTLSFEQFYDWFNAEEVYY